MISPTVDTNSRTVKVRVKIANDKQLLKPGMFVRVNIMLESRKDVIAVPQESIMTSKDGRSRVFVVFENIAFLRDVKTGALKEGWVAIQKGVKAGERVVVEGQDRLKDLTSVEPTEINR